MKKLKLGVMTLLCKANVIAFICIFSFSILFSSSKSFAASCEDFVSANVAIAGWVASSTSDINEFRDDIIQFIDEDFETATIEMEQRLDELDTNVRDWFGNWWNADLQPSLRSFTQQYNVAIVDQSRNLGSFIDAQTQDVVQRIIQEEELSSHRRHTPSEMACQADTISIIEGRTRRTSRAITKGLGFDLAQIGLNVQGTQGATGATDDLGQQWKRYVDLYCNEKNNNGEAGCTGAKPLVDKDLHIGDLLWGDQLTVDLSVADNRKLFETMLRTIVDPIAPENYMKSTLTTPTGRQRVLERRSLMARKQAVVNVFGQLMAMRVNSADTPVFVADASTQVKGIRTESGVLPANIAQKPSYREIMVALNKDRHRHPEQILRLGSNTYEAARNQIDMRSSHLKIMNDIYKRFEELTLLLATELAFDLDKTQMNINTQAGLTSQ